MKLLLATRNADKILEILALLGDGSWDVVSLSDFPGIPDIQETGSTLLENAFLKARTANKLSGLPSVADDTGLEVDCLKGAPGVYSSRFAGEKASYDDNVRKLLTLLSSVPEEKRTARFRCVSALVDGQKEEWVEGVCEGVILSKRQGSGGFGYDPVFFVPMKGKTLAEMSVEEKNEISHRGEAFRRMARLLNEVYGEPGVKAGLPRKVGVKHNWHFGA